MVSLEVKNTTCEVKNTMCEVKNTCWRLITEKKKYCTKRNQDSFLEDTAIGTIQWGKEEKYHNNKLSRALVTLRKHQAIPPLRR